MILKIHSQSLLDPFQDSKFYSRWQLHENAKQIYPIQFLQVVHDNGLFVVFMYLYHYISVILTLWKWGQYVISGWHLL